MNEDSKSWLIYDEMVIVSKIIKYGYDKALLLVCGDAKGKEIVEKRKEMDEEQLREEWRNLCDELNKI